MQPFLIGIVLALLIGVTLTWLGMDRDRSLYPAIMMVIALLYSLFGVIGGSTETLILEIAIGLFFFALAVIGFKKSLWFVVLALAGHGLFDFVHGRFIDNPGVPSFWPAFCGAYDIAAAGYLAVLIYLDRVRGHHFIEETTIKS